MAKRTRLRQEEHGRATLWLFAAHLAGTPVSAELQQTGVPTQEDCEGAEEEAKADPRHALRLLNRSRAGARERLVLLS